MGNVVKVSATSEVLTAVKMKITVSCNLAVW
jgi:hypothetical protein